MATARYCLLCIIFFYYPFPSRFHEPNLYFSCTCCARCSSNSQSLSLHNSVLHISYNTIHLESFKLLYVSRSRDSLCRMRFSFAIKQLKAFVIIMIICSSLVWQLEVSRDLRRDHCNMNIHIIIHAKNSIAHSTLNFHMAINLNSFN